MIPALAGFFFVLVCVDMGVKQYIEDFFDEKEERDTRAAHVVFRKVYNKGFLLDALDHYPGLVRRSSLALGAVLLVYNLRLFLERGRRLEKLGITLLSAGAFSNIYDRVIRGKVIDYIGFKSRSKWLSRITANLADFYVLAGSLLATLGRIKKADH
ncbi:MAG TPA: signal peptidase II [Candidatus Dorea gallistercoris]|uniref:Signal peptidase II n=1 Tax=Candidatus Dorea gallistercoris TaxID=2838542 RepID=A0A9D1R925_9FIRM|nr:signal peptidase II [Candidatus Dorea gallistercoris]